MNINEKYKVENEVILINNKMILMREILDCHGLL